MSTFRTHKTSADRSASDRRRHRTKIEKAIKEGVHDIVADESIIGQDGKKRIKIPVRGIKEYQFVYGSNSKRAGSSAGSDVTRGQVIGKGSPQPGQGQESGPPGEGEGEEYYEVELTLEELAGYLFDDLELPDLEKKRFTEVTQEKPKRKGYRTHGIRPRLDKKKTLRNKIRRRAIAERTGDIDEEDEIFPINERDLMYRHVAPSPRENTNAVIFFLMDTSGSMTKTKKFLARSFFFLTYQFIRYRYDSVDIVFISHDSDAREVDEEKFFTKGSSGGTKVSPALDLMKEIIDKRYHPSSWNIYGFHCSDGDNWGSDVARSTEITLDLKERCQLYGYIEVDPGEDVAWRGSRKTTMMEAYVPLEDRKFKIAKLTNKADVWPQFKKLFGGKLDV